MLRSIDDIDHHDRTLSAALRVPSPGCCPATLGIWRCGPGDGRKRDVLKLTFLAVQHHRTRVSSANLHLEILLHVHSVFHKIRLNYSGNWR